MPVVHRDRYPEIGLLKIRWKRLGGLSLVAFNVGRMWRTLVVAAVFYAVGYPALDGYRPAALDAPLQAFYQQVNRAGQEGQKALASINSARASYFKAYMGRAEKQLRAPQ
jgi:hypothetical protein